MLIISSSINEDISFVILKLLLKNLINFTSSEKKRFFRNTFNIINYTIELEYFEGIYFSI